MTERELNALPAELSSQLRYLDRKVRGLAALRGMGVVCVVLCAGVGTGVLIDWLLDLGVELRTTILLGVFGAALAAVIITILKPLVRRTSSAELAALVDTSFPDLRERIESTVELADPDLPEAHKGSAYMRSRLMRETVRQADRVDFGAAADTTSTFRWVFVGVLSFLLIVAPFGFSKEGYGLMLSRFLAPWRNLERATNLYFEVPHGDRTVARGDDVTIQALPRWRLAPGELPEFAWLRWHNVDGETDRRRMDWSESNASYVATLPNVFTSFQYDVSAGRTRTRSYHIDVAERPHIAQWTLEIVPPAYTGRASRILDGAVGRTEVFERSTLTFDLTFNKPVSSAEFLWLTEEESVGRTPAPSESSDGNVSDPASADRISLELNAGGTEGRLTMEAVRSGPYAVILQDNRGLRSRPNAARELIVIPDMPPQIEWADLNPSQLVNIAPIEARPDDDVSLPVRAIDDVGIHELTLDIELIQRRENLGPLVAETPLLGQPAIPYRFDLALSDFEVRHGDLLSVRARAVDSRPVPDPQQAFSPARLIRISNNADPAGLRALMQEQQRLRDAIEQIKQDVNDDRETARELEAEAAQSPIDKQPAERRAEIGRLAQRQREIQQRLEQLASVFADHPLQRTIADDTQQIADEPIDRARDSFEQAEAEPASQQRQRLRKAIGDLSTADKKLEQLLNQFDELAALERDLQQLQRLAEEAERLADDVDQFERDWDELERLQKAEALSGQQQQTQESQLADRQMDLQDEQQDLASALDHLLEERPEILEAARQRQLEQLRELADQAQQLAKHQDRLATSMSREKDEPPQPPSPETQPPPENSAGNPNQTDPPEEAPEPIDREQGPADEGAREVSPVQQQQQLAADAARQALETARQQGVQSVPAQQARQFAQRARQAAEEAERGLLSEAADSAQQAAQSAERASEQLQESAETPPARMTEQAESLAEQQAEVAEQLRESSRSPEERHAAQQQGQEEITQQTTSLEQQFAEAAEQLGSEPLNEEQAGNRARAAQEAAAEAQQSQRRAQEQIEQQRPREAAEPAREAARSLRQAAQRAAQAGRQSGQPEESPVPGEVGEQVADARRELEQAGQQLQQAGPSQQGQPSNRSEQGQASESNQGQQQSGQEPGEAPEGTPPSETGQPSESPEAGNQSGKNGQPSSEQGMNDGQSQPGQNAQPGQNGQPTSQPSNRAGSESMREVAESLLQAAQQMGLQRSQRSQNSGQDQQSGNSEQGADGPQGGYGARGGLSLAELEAELGRISARNWGQLPDRVESELQQAQQKKPDADYARLIRLYFEEVARGQSAADGLQASGAPQASGGRQPADEAESPQTGSPSND